MQYDERHVKMTVDGDRPPFPVQNQYLRGAPQKSNFLKLQISSCVKLQAASNFLKLQIVPAVKFS